MNDDLKRTLEALDGVRECGDGWKALCPAHDDTNASLSVAAGDRAPVVVKCHAGCEQRAVLDVLRRRMNGHTPAVLSGESGASSSPAKSGTESEEEAAEKHVPEWDLWDDGQQVDAYVYTDAEGTEQFEVVRFEPKPDHPAHGLDKEFLQRRHAPEHPKANRDGYVWGRGDISPELYRLPEVRAAAEAGRVIFIVEGEKDVETLREAGLTATTCAQGTGEWKDRYATDLEGAHVIVIPDNDTSGAGHATDVAASLHGKAASVRLLGPMPGVEHKGDVTDWMNAGGSAEELRTLASKTSEWDPPEEEPPEKESKHDASTEDGNKQSGGEDSRKQSEVLLDVAASWELFHTSKHDAYATFGMSGARQTAQVGSSTATDALRYGFYEQRGKSPSAQAITDANHTLRATARFDGEKKDVHLRVAEHDGCIYVDLCNDDWEAAKITTDGWEVVSDPPVKFRRVQGMKALPRPKRGGSLGMLRNHVRLSDDDFRLLLGFLVQCLRPVGPYPILELSGEQGSGKSTAAKMIRALIDPSHLPIRARPRKERNLVIAAENAWALAFDNMSGVQPWLSDALCRLSTGGGFGTRKLYADREEEIFYARRPLILNGINKLTGRSDLADRAIRLELETIPEAERRTEADVWERFKRDRPALLGALFDAVATALQREPGVELDRLPRMADFARWAVAAEPQFPNALNTNGRSGSAFLKAYRENRAEASKSAVEADTVASAVRAMLNDVGEWTGTTTELMEDLTPYLPDPEKPPSDFPSRPQDMGKRLKRIMPSLRAVGVERTEGEGPKGRLMRFQINGKKAVEAAETAEGPARHATNGDSRSATSKPGCGKAAEAKEGLRNGNRPAQSTTGDSSATSQLPQRDARGSKGDLFQHSDRVRTPDGKGEVLEVTVEDRVAVRHDGDAFSETDRVFDPEQVEKLN